MEQSEENKLIESSNKYILNLIFSVQKRPEFSDNLRQ